MALAQSDMAEPFREAPYPTRREVLGGSTPGASLRLSERLQAAGSFTARSRATDEQAPLQ